MNYMKITTAGSYNLLDLVPSPFIKEKLAQVVGDIEKVEEISLYSDAISLRTGNVILSFPTETVGIENYMGD